MSTQQVVPTSKFQVLTAASTTEEGHVLSSVAPKQHSSMDAASLDNTTSPRSIMSADPLQTKAFSVAQDPSAVLLQLKSLPSLAVAEADKAKVRVGEKENTPACKQEQVTLEEAASIKSTVSAVTIKSTAVTPKAEQQEPKPTLLILCSSLSLNRQVGVRQELAYTILSSKGVSFTTLDGADPSNKDRRNELFAISGKRAVYPQFFLQHSSNATTTTTTTFWGDWERLETSNEMDTLVQDLGVEATPLQPMATATIATTEESITTTANSTNNVSATIIGTLPSKKTLLVLYSSQSLDRQVVANQQQLFTILQAQQIPYETLDGADIHNRHRRAELFAISNLRAIYPQIFIRQPGSKAPPHFWGEWEQVEAANEMGTLDFGIAIDPSDEESAATNLLPVPTMVEEAPDNQDQQQPVQAVMEEKEEEEVVAILPKAHVAEDKPTESDATTFEPEQLADTKETHVSNSNEPKAAGDEPTGTAQGAGSTPPAESSNENEQAPSKEGGLPPRPPSKGKDSNTASEKTSSVESIKDKRQTETDITIYGATGHVGKHCATYLMQKSLSFDGILQVTLAGRNAASLEKVRSDLSKKMGHLATIYPDSVGRCVFYTVAADCNDAQAIHAMVVRSKVIIQCAGPFAECGTNIVASCARAGVDYVDITGEISWAGEMRATYGEAAAKSGARIVSLCGFDSVPSDLAVFAAVQALREQCKPQNVEIESATTFHYTLGKANGGTIRTAAAMPVNLAKCFSRRIPFLMEDPLVLTHPRVRFDPEMENTRDRLAKSEWLNQLPSFHTIFNYGASAPFLMAPVNTKVVNASAISLKYGPKFVYKERYLPVGFKMTTRMRFVSVIPAIFVQLAVLFGGMLLKLPIIGPILISWIAPPGSGCSEMDCRTGVSEVYAEVSTAVDDAGLVARANCLLEFEGDAANWVTSQCVTEAALAFIINKDELPPRTKDGFGTPAEVFGNVLLERMKKSTIRPLTAVTSVRKATSPLEWQMYP